MDFRAGILGVTFHPFRPTKTSVFCRAIQSMFFSLSFFPSLSASACYLFERRRDTEEWENEGAAPLMRVNTQRIQAMTE